MITTSTHIRERKKMGAFAWINFAVLVLYAFSLVFLILWSLMSSLKEVNDFYDRVMGFPRPIAWSNYVTVFKNFDYPISATADHPAKQITMVGMYANSLLYAVGCSVVHVFVTAVTAYLCARFNYKISKVIFSVVIVTMTLPSVSGTTGTLRILHALHLYDTMIGQWIMSAHFLSGTTFLILYSTFKSMSAGFIEAAKVDGAGNFRILFRIVFPLVITTMTTLVLMGFIGYWNNFQTPLIYIPSYPTIALGMFRLSRTNINNLARQPMRLAAAMTVFVPIFVIFALTHKRLMGNLTMGGLKG